MKEMHLIKGEDTLRDQMCKRKGEQMLAVVFCCFLLLCQASVEITTEKTSYIGNENVIVQVVISKPND